MTSVEDCPIIQLPRIERAEGSLTPVEGCQTVPFEIRRVYYLYDVVAGAERGGHAHVELDQFLVCVMGSFTVLLDDGRCRREIELNRGHYGLHIVPMIWRELRNFSSGAICLVLASRPYEESDYIRDRVAFLARKLVDAVAPVAGGDIAGGGSAA